LVKIIMPPILNVVGWGGNIVKSYQMKVRVLELTSSSITLAFPFPFISVVEEECFDLDDFLVILESLLRLRLLKVSFFAASRAGFLEVEAPREATKVASKSFVGGRDELEASAPDWLLVHFFTGYWVELAADAEVEAFGGGEAERCESRSEPEPDCSDEVMVLLRCFFCLVKRCQDAERDIDSLEYLV
jgi:hypothetical protein